MRFKRQYLIGIGLGITIVAFDILLFLGTKWFIPGLIIAVSIGWLQVWTDYFLEDRLQKEYEGRFLEFVRNLAGAIKSGMPAPRAISHVSKLDYGPLSRYIKKLGHQVEWSIPIHKALLFFSNSTKNDIIKRSVSTVIEAEQSGGNIEEVLESITSSLIEIKKIKETRRASVQSQIVQSYVIFFVFIGVMLVIQKMLLPYLLMSSGGATILEGDQQVGSIVVEATVDYSSLSAFIVTAIQWFTSMKAIFLMLSLIQGFFAGIIIGKLSEGNINSGIKHSLILMTLALFIMTAFA